MRNESRRPGFTKVEFLVILFINVILIALLYPAIKLPNPDGPVGKMIPVTTPDEKTCRSRIWDFFYSSAQLGANQGSGA